MPFSKPHTNWKCQYNLIWTQRCVQKQHDFYWSSSVNCLLSWEVYTKVSEVFTDWLDCYLHKHTHLWWAIRHTNDLVWTQACYLLITALRPQSRSAVICRNLRWNSGTLWDSASHTPVTGTTCIKSPHLLSGAFHTHHSLNCFPENATDCVCGLCVHQDDALQGQTEGEPEGHLHRNLGHRVVETHVEFLGDGLEQHPPERQR